MRAMNKAASLKDVKRISNMIVSFEPLTSCHLMCWEWKEHANRDGGPEQGSTCVCAYGMVTSVNCADCTTLTTEWCNQHNLQFYNESEWRLGPQWADIDNRSYHHAKELPQCSIIISVMYDCGTDSVLGSVSNWAIRTIEAFRTAKWTDTFRHSVMCLVLFNLKLPSHQIFPVQAGNETPKVYVK